MSKVYEETNFSKIAESVGKSNGTPLSTPPYVTEPDTASTYMYWKTSSKSLCYSHRTG
jgi:purine nucleoside permease